MKLSFLSSFFKPREEQLVVPDSLLLKKIKSLADNSSFLVYANREIFHHKTSYLIPLMIYDNLRGIYIFEIKEWSYDDLKNATASKAESVENSKNTLAFDKTHAIIKQKFNELLHNDGVAIFNYLLMENLSADEYEHLDDALKEILPKDKIIFSDSDTSEIFKKLQSAAQENSLLPTKETVLGTLFIQYSIAENDGEIHLCNQEQIELIDAKITGSVNVSAPTKSGKSSTVLLKSIKELFKQERQKIIFLKPTTLSKDIQHKYFLEQLEHAIIDIDLMSFEILTPIELINRHLLKLKMPSLEKELYIDEKLMKKTFDAAELIICDDANLLPQNFIHYLKHIQKKSDLLLINDPNSEATFSFTTSYLPQEREIRFYKTNPHAKALHLIASLLQTANANDILVVSNSLSREKLKEDLLSFIEEETLCIDATQHLIDQKLDSVLLATYSDIIDLSAQHVIMMDICFTDKEILEYTCNSAQTTLSLLYEEDCSEIDALKEKYESSKE